MNVFVNVCVVVEGMYTYKTGHFGNDTSCISLVFKEVMKTCRVSMFTRKTGNFGNESLCLCLSCC